MIDIIEIIGGVVNIETRESVKHDFIAIKNNVYLHKQVEMRDGLVFMRMKKRAVMKL